MPAKISITNKPLVMQVAEIVERAMNYVDSTFTIEMNVNCANNFIAADVCYYSNEPVRICVYGRYIDRSVEETAAEIIGQAVVRMSEVAAEDISF